MLYTRIVSIFIPWILLSLLKDDVITIPKNYINSEVNGSETNLFWSEDFDTDGLPNPKHWSYDVGDHGWGNNELQYYTSSNLENAIVKNGTLKIIAKKDDTQPKGFTSARLVTKNKIFRKYGYIEVKAKLPKGIGTWPAIWMLPEENKYGGWPSSGEIDIMEHVGYDPGNVHGTVHTLAFNHTKGTQRGKIQSVPNFDDSFHVYAIDWQEDKIDFYIDGVRYHTFENTKKGFEEWPFDHDYHLILNIAVGGNWGGAKGIDESIWPQTLEIDHIRWYIQKP
jgi:beta-glucanase (GH16 family)